MRHIMLLLFRDAPAVKLHSKIYNPWYLRACPREDQAGVAHAISPIFLKLGLVKGFTQKLHRPKPFDLWILPSEYRPPPLVFQGKPLKTHQNMAVKLEALLLLLFSRFYFYLA